MCRNAKRQIVRSPLKQRRNPRRNLSNASWDDQPELAQQAADLVGLSGARLHKPLTRTVHRQHRLLLHTLDRHKAHVRPHHRFTDRFSIGRIVLVGLDVGLDELRRHQTHRVPIALQRARPVVRATARFHADQTRRQLGEEHRHLLAPQLLAQHHFAALVHSVHLKDILRQINANRRNLHADAPLCSVVADTSTVAHRCRMSGGVHPIAFGNTSGPLRVGCAS